MKTITVDTDLHCQGCVDRLTPILDGDNQIKSWEVDLKPSVKRLTVSGDNISNVHINELLHEAGYSILNQEKAGFWNDFKLWNRASFNTLNCLIGCSIGDFGMVFFLQAYYPSTPMVWQMVLAIIAGLCTSILLETVILKSRESFGWGLAFKTAFGMSFISMVGMELAMTSTDFMITGGKAAFDDPMYWFALVPALVVGFITPLPYNYYKLKKYNKACH